MKRRSKKSNFNFPDAVSAFIPRWDYSFTLSVVIFKYASCNIKILDLHENKNQKFALSKKL